MPLAQLSERHDTIYVYRTPPNYSDPPASDAPASDTPTWSPADIAGLIRWYDFSDITTLYQDSARTTPVTADGDPIGSISDKSTTSDHALQATIPGQFQWFELSSWDPKVAKPTSTEVLKLSIPPLKVIEPILTKEI